MASPTNGGGGVDVSADRAVLLESIKRQGDVVRRLKEEKAEKAKVRARERSIYCVILGSIHSLYLELVNWSAHSLEFHTKDSR